jgi:hypothetical protein
MPWLGMLVAGAREHWDEIGFIRRKFSTPPHSSRRADELRDPFFPRRGDHGHRSDAHSRRHPTRPRGDRRSVRRWCCALERYGQGTEAPPVIPAPHFSGSDSPTFASSAPARVAWEWLGLKASTPLSFQGGPSRGERVAGAAPGAERRRPVGQSTSGERVSSASMSAIHWRWRSTSLRAYA